MQWPSSISQPYPLDPYGGPSSYPCEPSQLPVTMHHEGVRPSSRARSMPSGSTAKSGRGNISPRGCSKGKKKYPLIPSVDQPSLSLPSRSIAKSKGSQKAKPYDIPEKGRGVKSFHEVVWDLAKRWFVVKLWREGFFFLKADTKDRLQPQSTGALEKCRDIVSGWNNVSHH